jgi:hypothetical protein
VLEYPWDLSTYDAAPTTDDAGACWAPAMKVSEGGEIDVDDGSGRVVSRFLPELQRDLGLVYQPEHWDELRLATWLCRNLPEPSLTHASKQAFVAAWLTELLRRERFHAGARQSAEVPDPQSARGAHSDAAQGRPSARPSSRRCSVTMLRSGWR